MGSFADPLALAEEEKQQRPFEPLDAGPRVVLVDWKKLYILVDWDIASPFFVDPKCFDIFENMLLLIL